MIVNKGILIIAVYELREALKKVEPWIEEQLEEEKIVEIVEVHALGAAASGLGVAWLPGAGSLGAAAAMVGFIWSMYFRINKALGLKMSKTLLKTLASAVMSNIAQAAVSVVGTIAVSAVLSFTGIGNVASSLIMAALDYAVVLVGGIIYLKLLTQLFSAGENPSEMCESDLKKTVETVIRQEDISGMLKSARDDYKRARKEGSVTGKEKIDLEEE